MPGPKSSAGGAAWGALRRFAGCAALAAQQDDLVHHDLRDVSLLTFLVFPTPASQVSFDVHLLALGQIRRQVFSAPQDDVVPVGFFFPVAGLRVLEAAIGRQSEF
jgi:hypothetical protein